LRSQQVEAERDHEQRVEGAAAQPEDERGVGLAEGLAGDPDAGVGDQEFAGERPGASRTTSLRQKRHCM
jgi:hypothetical protein